MNDCFPKHQDAIKASLEPLEQHLDTVVEAIAEVDARSNQFAEQGKTIKHEIKTAFNQLHEALNRREQVLKEQVDHVVNETQKRHRAQRKDFELSQIQFNGCLEFVQESLRTGTQEEVLSVKEQVGQRCGQMSREFDPNAFQPRPREILTYCNTDLESIVDSIGKLYEVKVQSVHPSMCHVTGEGVQKAREGEITSFTLHCLNKDGKKCSDANAPVTGELISCDDGAVVKCEVTKKDDSTYELKYTPRSSGQHNLHVKMYGTHIKNSPFTIVAEKATLQFQGTHVRTIEGLKRPRQVALTRMGEITVVERDANCVSVFDQTGQRLRSFGNQKSGECWLNYPRGVAVCGDNTVVVAVQHCVKKFTVEGQFIDSVGSQGSGPQQFNTPYSVAFNATTKTIYICDAYNHRIQVLDSNLSFLRCFGTVGSDPGEFSKPASIAVDSDGNILVADCNNHRVQVLTPEGEFLCEIKQRGPGMEPLQSPISVCIDDNDCVYVLEQTKNRVSIFDNKGNFIKSFGKQGTEAGEFNQPYAIVRDENYVYVSDTHNDRIQLFC